MNYNDPETVPPTWKVGEVILDRYEVKQVFTGGGMGLVYRVHHRDWNMDLAVKSPRPEFFQTQQQIENFEREAETWVNLGLHPNIVSCYYVRRLGGTPRIFAEFVEGGTLADWIRTKKLYEGGKEKALERTMDIAIQFAWGLQYAHEKSLVHQDVKPGNVLVSLDGVAKVGDFGLANARRASGESTTVAPQPGQSILVPGSGFMTPEYASPEQIRGEPLSRKTDIWSWAVSLLELLLGELTWTSGIAVPAVIDELDAGQLDKELIALLEGCFGLNARERFTSFQPIVAALIAYYTSQFGTYPRSEPQPSELSSDETNNRAVSLADLDKDEDALLALEAALSSDPTHTITIYNYALINRRMGYKSDEFGRDALHALLQRDPNDALALVANALFCMERGLAVRAADLLTRLEALKGERPPHAADLEAMLNDTPGCELERPVMFKASDGEIRFLQVSPDGTHLIVRDSDGLASYVAATGERCVKIGNEFGFLQLSGDNALLKNGGRVFTWNLRDEPVILDAFQIEIPAGACFAVSNSGTRCCVVDYDVLRMVDTDSGETLWEEELDYAGDEPSIKDVAFSADDRCVSFARSDHLEDLQVRDAEDGCTIRMGKCAVDGCKELIPFGKHVILSVNWNRLLQLWDLEERTALGSRQLHQKARLGVPSANTELIASLEPNGSLTFLETPHLTLLATIAWWELPLDTVRPCGKPTCVASSDGRTWHVGTSEGEVIRFRLSAPQHAPVLIGKPASSEQLALRWNAQARLLDGAKRAVEAGELSSALEMSHQAVLIRGGRSLEAVQLHDRLTAVGRKQSIAGMHLAFDLERTILGGQFQLLDVSNDGRCALVERTYFRRNKEYAGDHYRIVHLPHGRAESLPNLAIEGKLLRKMSPNKDSIIVGTKTGLSIVSIGEESSARALIPPPVWGPTAYQGGRILGFSRTDGLPITPIHEPSYYASGVQFALQGRVIVASDLAADWCSDKGRCEEWHVYFPPRDEVSRIHTDTPHLRVMPDGFHAYAVSPRGICWMDWPFRNAFQTFRYPSGVFGEYSNHSERRELLPDAIAVSSDGGCLFFGDYNGRLHAWDVKGGYYEGWKHFDAHADGITRVCAGTDSSFVATIASDGVKIWQLGSVLTGAYNYGLPEKRWEPGCESLLWHADFQPDWISDDFRFLIERSGVVWEVEWNYTFEPLSDLNRLVRPHVEGYLKARRVLAKMRGETVSWERTDWEALSHELAKCGYGMVSPEQVNSIVTADYQHLL